MGGDASFISENPIVAKLQYGLKITFIFILILFLDSVNRVYRVQVELAAATDSNKGSACVFPILHLPLHTYTHTHTSASIIMYNDTSSTSVLT